MSLHRAAVEVRRAGVSSSSTAIQCGQGISRMVGKYAGSVPHSCRRSSGEHGESCTLEHAVPVRSFFAEVAAVVRGEPGAPSSPVRRVSHVGLECVDR